MSIRLITPSQATAIPLAILKAHLRLDEDRTGEDGLIMGYLRAAVAHVEATCNLSLLTQTFDETFDGFPCSGPIRLGRWPVQSVTSIVYLDSAGAAADWDAASYTVSAADALVQPAYSESFPTALDALASVTVRYVAGYGDDANDIPEAIRHALMVWVADAFAHRESVVVGQSVSPAPSAVEALLQPFRRYSFA